MEALAHIAFISGEHDEIIPPVVAIFSPSKQEIQQKSKATLVCLASGFYPDHLNLVWKVNGAKRTEGVGTDEFSTWNGSTYSLTSRLRISAREWFNPLNRFECVANFFKNAKLESIHKAIYGDAGEWKMCITILYKAEMTNQKGVGYDVKHIYMQLPYRVLLWHKYICNMEVSAYFSSYSQASVSTLSLYIYSFSKVS